MPRSILKALLLFISLPVLAQPAPADIVVQQLSTCDANFFRALRENESIFQQVAPVERRGDIAYWKVVDRMDESMSMLAFPKLIQGKVRLLGYFDEVVNLGSAGMYYSWGVIAIGSPAEISATIKPLVMDGSRLRKDGNVFVRSEIRDVSISNSSWMKNDSLSGGSIPKANTVERVFLVEEAGDKLPGAVRIGCSLQGAVTPQLLATERPDIEANVLAPISATNNKTSKSPFSINDVLIPYRHYDHDKKALLSGADRGHEGTKWKVIKITEAYITLELIEGEYKPVWANGKAFLAGQYTSGFFSSDSYRKAFPEAGPIDQIYDEFRKAD